MYVYSRFLLYKHYFILHEVHFLIEEAFQIEYTCIHCDMFCFFCFFLQESLHHPIVDDPSPKGEFKILPRKKETDEEWLPSSTKRRDSIRKEKRRSRREKKATTKVCNILEIKSHFA